MTRLASVPQGATPADDWRRQLTANQYDRYHPTLSNLVTILVHDTRWAGVLAWNDLTGQPEALKSPPWHDFDAPAGGAQAGALGDADALRLQAWLERSYPFAKPPARGTVEGALQVVCLRHRYHPVQEYLGKLEWDSTQRLDRWLVTYAGAADTEYTRLVGRWWMIQAVARAREPGCMAKYVLCLEGPQDLLKSTLCRTLAQPWFSETQIRDIGSKDSLIALRGTWVIELAEVDSLTRGDAARLKAFISARVDKFRPPYGKVDVEHPRSSVFIASVNPVGQGYFTDPTGAVRWWPVLCTRIDVDALQRDRDQLWAEAVALYEEGALRWPSTPAEQALCAEQQDDRYQVDAREEALIRWLKKPAGRQAQTDDDLTMLRLLEEGLGLRDADLRDRATQISVGASMHRLGYYVARRSTGQRERVYRLKG